MKVHLGSKPVTFASLALLVGAIMSYQKAPELSTNIIVATGAIAITNELLSKQYAQAAKAQADEVVNDMLVSSKKSEIAFSRTNSALIEAQTLANIRQKTIEELQKEVQELSLIRVGQSRKISEIEQEKNQLSKLLETQEEGIYQRHKYLITQEVRDRL
jgi:hypothetical protein